MKAILEFSLNLFVLFTFTIIYIDPTLAQVCSGVYDENQLKHALDAVPINPNLGGNPTTITICDDIYFSRTLVANQYGSGYDVSQKNIILKCNKTTRCILDANMNRDAIPIFRLLYGDKSKVTVQDINFNNFGSSKEYVITEGGVFYFENSVITVTQCSFSNNLVSWSGGSIYAVDSNTTVVNTIKSSPTIFQNNLGGAISIKGGNLLVEGRKDTFFFINNTIRSLGASSVDAWIPDSISITGVSFLHNSAQMVSTFFKIDFT